MNEDENILLTPEEISKSALETTVEYLDSIKVNQEEVIVLEPGTIYYFGGITTEIDYLGDENPFKRISEKTIQQLLDAKTLRSCPSGCKPTKSAVGRKKFTPGSWNISAPSGEDNA